MKPWTTKLTLGALAFSMISLAACEKDEVRATAQPGAAPTLTASANNLVLQQPNSEKNAVVYTWTPVSYGYQAVVSYSLQFDKKGGDFSSPISFDAGTATTKTLTVGDLNSVYQSKGLVSATTAPVATAVDVRVVSSIGGAGTPTVTSAVTSVMATPYAFCVQPASAKAWAIIGPAGNGWGDTDDLAMVYDCVTKNYTYTGPLKADAFKFRYGGNDPTTGKWKANLGGNSSTGGPLTQGGGDLKIAAAGTYTIVLTPGGFNPDGSASGGSYTIK